MDAQEYSIIAEMQASHRREYRARQSVTVVKTDEPWTPYEISALLSGLITEVASKTSHRDTVLVYGEYTWEQINPLLPGRNVSVEVVTGLDNPALPFFPW